MTLYSLFKPIFCNIHHLSFLFRLEFLGVYQRIKLSKLAQRTGLSVNNLFLLKTGKVRAIRFSTLVAICEALDCQPGDLLEYVVDEERESILFS